MTTQIFQHDNTLVYEFVLYGTYPGADKSLARPRRKQVRKHVTDARYFNNIETRAVINFFFSCKARRLRKFTPF